MSKCNGAHTSNKVLRSNCTSLLYWSQHFVRLDSMSQSNAIRAEKSHSSSSEQYHIVNITTTKKNQQTPNCIRMTISVTLSFYFHRSLCVFFFSLYEKCWCMSICFMVVFKWSILYRLWIPYKIMLLLLLCT